MKKITLFLLILINVNFITAQPEMTVIYPFDNCDGMPLGDINVPAQVLGEPPCECGVVENALLLDGNNDRVLLPDTLRSFFDDDFSVSFYFTFDNIDGNIDLFSFRTTCNQDSSFSITYATATNNIRAEFAKDFGDIFEISGPLDLSKCWHQVVVTKFNLEYSLFIDGELADRIQAKRQIPFGKNSLPNIANSPCLAFFEERISGKIDEFELRNFAITPAEIRADFLSPDRIIIPNTTLFEGENVLIETGPTCADNIAWTPTEFLDAPSIKDPLFTAGETNTYAVAFNNGGCISRDTVLINVVNPEILMCNDLLIPSAFTPNNDGINETYHISNKFLVDELLSFEIINRSGAIIYSTMDLDAGWDGSFKGQPVSPGIYMYKIQYTCAGESFNKVDNFMVLR